MPKSNEGIRLLLNAPLRRLRTKGFGVHSPFAFRFITGVIRKRYRYYAYGKIESLGHRSGVDVRFLKLLFRVAVNLDVRSAVCFGPQADVLRRTLSLVRSDMTFDAANAMLVVINGSNDPEVEKAAVAHCVAGEGTVIVNRRKAPELWRYALSRLDEYGMSFSGRQTGIIVARRSLPHQNFDIWT